MKKFFLLPMRLLFWVTFFNISAQEVNDFLVVETTKRETKHQSSSTVRSEIAELMESILRRTVLIPRTCSDISTILIDKISDLANDTKDMKKLTKAELGKVRKELEAIESAITQAFEALHKSNAKIMSLMKA